jgi:hypothetical protein
MRESEIEKVLKEILNYSEKTGIFTWKINRGKVKIGDIAGTLVKSGNYTYQGIRLFGKRYSAHRLAWLWAYGCWPAGEIDHINHNTLDNSLLNIREGTKTFNQQNQIKAHKDSTGKVLGVSRSDSKNRFRARIQIDGKEVSLGSFNSEEEAHAAYLKEKRKSHLGGTL